MFGEKTRERAQAVKAELVLQSRAQYHALVTLRNNEDSSASSASLFTGSN
jgi:hypothetical protein